MLIPKPTRWQTIGVVLAGIGFIVACVLADSTYTVLYVAANRDNYVQAEFIIDRVEVVRSGGGRRIAPTTDWIAHGEVHGSKEVLDLGQECEMFECKSENIADLFPAGAKVDVYYNKNAPRETDFGYSRRVVAAAFVDINQMTREAVLAVLWSGGLLIVGCAVLMSATLHKWLRK